MEHPGTTNAFQVATRSQLADEALDLHVLEAHHCRVTLALLKEVRLLEQLGDEEDAARLRKLLIGSILATDMAGHKDFVGLCAARARREDGETPATAADRESLVALLLHCADLSSPLQEADIDAHITDLIFAEFADQARVLGRLSRFSRVGRVASPGAEPLARPWPQARVERAAGRAVTVLLAETRHAKASMEVGFIQFLVRPAFTALVALVPDLAPFLERVVSARRAPHSAYACIQRARSPDPRRASCRRTPPSSGGRKSSTPRASPRRRRRTAAARTARACTATPPACTRCLGPAPRSGRAAAAWAQP